MKPPGVSLILLLLLFLTSDVSAQTGEAQASNSDDGTDVSTSFRPSVAVVIGVLSITFSLTCLLLMYVKFCHNSSGELFGRGGGAMGDLNHPLGILRSRRFSGIDKTVIESLPFFRFSSLKGSKEGLECSVCLSKFEDNEILRLLPKCKHAFHIGCVDKWLESHSSCPLCRYKVELNDLTMFTYSGSLRRDWSDLRDDPNVELVVQRETDRDGSSRFSIGSSFRKPDKSKKEGDDDQLLLPEGSGDPQFLHKFKHRIVVSDVVFKNRWSDVNYSDLMFLNSDMLNATSSQRFASLNEERKWLGVDGDEFCNSGGRVMSIREEMEKKRALERKVSVNNGRVCAVSVLAVDPSTSSSEANGIDQSKYLMAPAGKRSMSEVTSVSRFGDLGDRRRTKESSSSSSAGGGAGEVGKEEMVRRVWLAIARRTVMWLAGRERRPQPLRPHEPTRVSNV